MSKHLIRLVFNSRVNNYEDKIAFIAQQIKDRFGNEVDAYLPLERKANLAKLIYLKVSSFDDAMKLADKINEFLREPATTAGLQTHGIQTSGRSLDGQYAQGWRGTFAQRFDFK